MELPGQHAHDGLGLNLLRALVLVQAQRTGMVARKGSIEQVEHAALRERLDKQVDRGTRDGRII